MGTQRQQRGTRLTPEENWQIFLEASRKNTTDVEVCRKWGITTWQLKAIRTKAKVGSLEPFARVRAAARPISRLPMSLTSTITPSRLGS